MCDGWCLVSVPSPLKRNSCNPTLRDVGRMTTTTTTRALKPHNHHHTHLSHTSPQTMTMKASSSKSLSRADMFQAAGGAFLGAAALLTVAPQASNAESTLASRKVLYFRVCQDFILSWVWG